MRLLVRSPSLRSSPPPPAAHAVAMCGPRALRRRIRAGMDAPVTPVLITGLLVVGPVAGLWTCTCHPTLPMPGPPLGTATPTNSVRWSAAGCLDRGVCSRRGREGEYDMAGPSMCPLLQVRYRLIHSECSGAFGFEQSYVLVSW